MKISSPEYITRVRATRDAADDWPDITLYQTTIRISSIQGEFFGRPAELSDVVVTIEGRRILKDGRMTTRQTRVWPRGRVDRELHDLVRQLFCNL